MGNEMSQHYQEGMHSRSSTSGFEVVHGAGGAASDPFAQSQQHGAAPASASASDLYPPWYPQPHRQPYATASPDDEGGAHPPLPPRGSAGAEAPSSALLGATGAAGRPRRSSATTEFYETHIPPATSSTASSSAMPGQYPVGAAMGSGTDGQLAQREHTIEVVERMQHEQRIRSRSPSPGVEPLTHPFLERDRPRPVPALAPVMGQGGSRPATAESGGSGAYSRPTTAESGTTGTGATYSGSSSSRPSTSGGDSASGAYGSRPSTAGDSSAAYPVAAAMGAGDDGQLAQRDHAIEVAEATGQRVLARTPPPLIDPFLDAAAQQVERDDHGHSEEGKLISPIMSAPFSPEPTVGKSFAELQQQQAGDSSPLSTSTESNAPSSPVPRPSDDLPPPPRADLEPAMMTAAGMPAVEDAAPVPPPVPPRVLNTQQQPEPALRRRSSASAIKTAAAPTPAISTAAASSSKIPALGQDPLDPAVLLERNSYLLWQIRSGRHQARQSTQLALELQDLSREERAIDQRLHSVLVRKDIVFKELLAAVESRYGGTGAGGGGRELGREQRLGLGPAAGGAGGGRERLGLGHGPAAGVGYQQQGVAARR
ncbi:hypothetical protein H9P43_007960 [Blastocladiella emersonii ATCC 22665]|nr:hypothetical protein H9P43_007960 [Blastocladiella emersonii ATCC 22665]